MRTAGEGTGRRSGGSRPAERYGRHARAMPSRPVLVLLAVLVVAGGLGLAWLGYRNLGDRPIEGQVLDWRQAAPGRLSVHLAVHRDHPERAASCVLRARSRDGAQVGRTEVPVPPAVVREVARTAAVTVSGTAVVVDVYSCEYRP